MKPGTSELYSFKSRHCKHYNFHDILHGVFYAIKFIKAQSSHIGTFIPFNFSFKFNHLMKLLFDRLLYTLNSWLFWELSAAVMRFTSVYNACNKAHYCLHCTIIYQLPDEWFYVYMLKRLYYLKQCNMTTNFQSHRLGRGGLITACTSRTRTLIFGSR